MPPFIAYLRVSTAGQADGFGLDVQEQQIRDWARQHRHRIVAVESDVARSGADDVAHRPALARALGRLAAGEARGIVVARLDRLARDMILQETILADLHRVGLELHSASKAEDEHLVSAEHDPTRALVRRILGAVAAYERDVIRLRLRSGLMRKRQLGGFTGGRAPFGWAASGKALVEVPGEQEVLRRMLAARTSGASLQQIADQLNAGGVKPREAAAWHKSSVARILSRHDGTRPTPPIGSVKPAKTRELEAKK